jgi:hypothetical protein
MLFARPWASLCLLAGSLVGTTQAMGLIEDPDIKAISVGVDELELLVPPADGSHSFALTAWSP